MVIEKGASRVARRWGDRDAPFRMYNKALLHYLSCRVALLHD